MHQGNGAHDLAKGGAKGASEAIGVRSRSTVQEGVREGDCSAGGAGGHQEVGVTVEALAGGIRDNRV